MSRSYKKQAIIKDPSNTQGKKFSNRKLRRKTKQAIHHEDENMPLPDELINQYDICDFKIHYNKKEDGEYYNKAKRK